MKKKDRQELDKAIFKAMGMDPAKWLMPIYDGLNQLVNERINLAKLRSQIKKRKPQTAANQVFSNVIKEILPEGLAKFPDDFFSKDAINGKFKEIPLPKNSLNIQRSFFGKQELITEDGEKVIVSNPFEAQFVIFCQINGHETARLPEKPVEISRAVNNYKQYLKEIHNRLADTFYVRTLNQNLANRYLKQAWKKYNLPEIMD